MRPVESRLERRRRWPLYVVAIVCFGPLIPELLLGLIFLPSWLAMAVVELLNLANPSDEPPETLWGELWLTGVVVSGWVGFAGLFRVLTLDRETSTSSRKCIRGMVLVGLAGLCALDWPFFMPGNYD